VIDQDDGQGDDYVSPLQWFCAALTVGYLLWLTQFCVARPATPELPMEYRYPPSTYRLGQKVWVVRVTAAGESARVVEVGGLCGEADRCPPQEKDLWRTYKIAYCESPDGWQAWVFGYQLRGAAPDKVEPLILEGREE
jgi:hypothetical protein